MFIKSECVQKYIFNLTILTCVSIMDQGGPHCKMNYRILVFYSVLNSRTISILEIFYQMNYVDSVGFILRNLFEAERIYTQGTLVGF